MDTIRGLMRDTSWIVGEKWGYLPLRSGEDLDEAIRRLDGVVEP
jgi:hypothetical protein